MKSIDKNKMEQKINTIFNILFRFQMWMNYIWSEEEKIIFGKTRDWQVHQWWVNFLLLTFTCFLHEAQILLLGKCILLTSHCVEKLYSTSFKDKFIFFVSLSPSKFIVWVKSLLRYWGRHMPKFGVEIFLINIHTISLALMSSLLEIKKKEIHTCTTTIRDYETNYLILIYM